MRKQIGVDLVTVVSRNVARGSPIGEQVLSSRGGLHLRKTFGQCGELGQAASTGREVARATDGVLPLSLSFAICRRCLVFFRPGISIVAVHWSQRPTQTTKDNDAGSCACMQSRLFRRLFHRKLSGSVQQYLLREDIVDEPYPGQLANAKPGAIRIERAITSVMPRTIRELLTDSKAAQPRYVRLHNADYTSRDLLSEILSMANRIARRISDAQLSSTDKRWWPVREMASKWDSIKAYPEMLQDADVELLKILVLDAYADMERLEGTAGRA